MSKSVEEGKIEKPDLIHVSDEEAGIIRQKCGKGFIYKLNGEKVTSNKILSRIKELVIPPVWEEVWICKDARGHLQCTGKDLKGRKQYIYHPDWVAYNQQHKYDRLKSFGEALPAIRKQIEVDLEGDEWTKNRVLALVVHLLDEYYLRIGNKYYSTHNDTFGLTTLRRKHVDTKKKNLVLTYKAKSNKMRKVNIYNKKLCKLVREMSALPGYEVFRYKNGNNQWENVDSHDVNEYIKKITGGTFTAKDFRTWAGTKLAIESYEAVVKEIKENPGKKFETALVRAVAKKLGNTVATCRKYYIHPIVLSQLSQEGWEPERPIYGKHLLERSEKILMMML